MHDEAGVFQSSILESRQADYAAEVQAAEEIERTTLKQKKVGEGRHDNGSKATTVPVTVIVNTTSNTRMLFHLPRTTPADLQTSFLSRLEAAVV